MSEWHARDTSRKVKTVAHTKGMSGKPLASIPPYGFTKDPNDKYKWIVDEPAAAIVRRIFQMAFDGMGPYQISKVLTEEKVEKPSYYAYKNGRTTQCDTATPYAWNIRTVCVILSRLEYVGSTVNFKTSKESYKDKKITYNAKEDWAIFENTHEAIVSKEMFDTVQKLRGTPRRMDKTGEANPLTGLVFCGSCGAKMYNSRQSKKTYEAEKFGRVYTAKAGDYYNCSKYCLARNSNKDACSNHYIRTSVIQEMVLNSIRKISGYVRENEAEFVQKVREMSTVQQAEMAKSHTKQIAQNERRISELDTLFRKVYEDNAIGKLSDERFEQMAASYDTEQLTLKHQTAELQTELDAFNADNEKTERFLELVQRYTQFEELTTPMLNEYIHKIVVYAPDRSSGERVQDMDIYFNFIGKFDLSEEEIIPTPEELAEQERLRQKRAKQREANRRWYAKKKAEQEQQKSA
jgi:hypothetical protein